MEFRQRKVWGFWEMRASFELRDLWDIQMEPSEGGSQKYGCVSVNSGEATDKVGNVAAWDAAKATEKEEWK